ncbi:pseudouridine synthase [Marinobacter zhanjiangensis]|uniref:Pseudouridine synthase n=1 Tax=Marinobacter zhanjiangensis TaxID=578215 RepID=A0ABQ3BCZ0_9GAMM|nr:pseudouridine synthase [Marinobacter zhanjiangensis]GGY84881.1 pseudouridine synthase [Marinobacter zhanjiangensis]
MAALILLNKPFHTLCQFSDDQGRATLGDYVDVPHVYPAGRLDYDSEGLVLLTDDGGLQHRIASPRQKMTKTYLVQVEGNISDEALEQLRRGLHLKDGATRPASARRIDPPALWPRNPPVRERARIPTSWLELKLTEGRNRQVRRMTAATGHPTLRLVRWQIGEWSLEGLAPGAYRSLTIHSPASARRPGKARAHPGKTPGQRQLRRKPERKSP